MSKLRKLIKKSVICTALFVLIPAFVIPVNTQVSGEDVWNAVMANAGMVLNAQPGDPRIEAIDRLLPVGKYDPVYYAEHNRILSFRVDSQKGLSVDYILLAFGIIGFIAIRRRPNL